LTNDAEATQDLGQPDEELDPRVSTPDDGIPSFDEEDSEEVQAQLDPDEDHDEAEADYEEEH
jgi:hypothetical protein